jgi:hypothetical protein
MGSSANSTYAALSRFLRVTVFRNNPLGIQFPQGGQSGSVYTAFGGWGTAGRGNSTAAPSFFLNQGYESPAFPDRSLATFDPRIVQPSDIQFNLEPFRQEADGTGEMRWRGEEDPDFSLFRTVFTAGSIFTNVSVGAELVPALPSLSIVLPRSSVGVVMLASLEGRASIVPPFLFFGNNRLIQTSEYTQPEFRFSVPVLLDPLHQDIWYIAADGTPTPLGLMVHPFFRLSGANYLQRDSAGILYATCLSGGQGNARPSIGGDVDAQVYFANCLSVPLDPEAMPPGQIAGVLRTFSTQEQILDQMYGGISDATPTAMKCREPIMDIGEIVFSPYVQDAMPILSALAKHASFDAPVYRRFYADSPISFIDAQSPLSPDDRSIRVPDGTPEQSLASGNIRLVQLRTRAALSASLPLGDEHVALPWAPPQNNGAVAFNGTVIRGVRIEFVPWIPPQSNVGPRTHGMDCEAGNFPPIPDPWVGPFVVTTAQYGGRCLQDIFINQTFDEFSAHSGLIMNDRLFRRPPLSGRAYDCGPDPFLPAGAFRYAGQGHRASRSFTIQIPIDTPPSCPPPPPPTPQSKCVLPNLGCVITTATDCDERGGQFFPDEPCDLPPLVGSCTFPEGDSDSQFGGAGGCIITSQADCDFLGGQFSAQNDCSGNPFPPPPPPGTSFWPPGACKTPRAVGGDGGRSQFGGVGSGITPPPTCTGDFVCSQLSEYSCLSIGGQWFGPWSGCYETGLYNEWTRKFRTDAYNIDTRTDHVEIYAQLGASIYSPLPNAAPAPEHLISLDVIEDVVPLLGMQVSVRHFGSTHATVSGTELVIGGQYRQYGVLGGGFVQDFAQYCNAFPIAGVAPPPSPPTLLQTLLFNREQTAQLLDGGVVTATRWNDTNPDNRSLPYTFFAGEIRRVTQAVDSDTQIFPAVQYHYGIRVQLLFDTPSPAAPGPHVPLTCPPPSNPFP